MYVVKHRTFFFWLTGLILAGAVGSLVFFGLPLAIDFTGGSLVEVAYEEGRPDITILKQQVEAAGIEDASLRESGTSGVTVRVHTLSPEEHETLLAALGQGTAMTEVRFNSIGPSLGSELATKALYAIAMVTLAIMLYIAFAFRKVSRPVPSWGYGIVVVLMLAIDIIVPAGFFAAYAHFTGAEADALFVVALLALLGYCVNDVIVIFDRVREHLKWNEEKRARNSKEPEEPFEITIGKSIDETMGRSINTSLTVALALLAIIFFGAESTRNFAIVMLVGVVIGTFSSITRSAPLLIPIAKFFQKKA
ncbi:MAG TPA: protein translocase subunit SecF [Candidatus Paceibacterota bacterium]|nr:protein translocase subunit SecF [Candidatus Paceibacterota bacterium]